MLDVFLGLFKSKKQPEQKKRHLSTQYFYPAASENKNKSDASDVSELYNDVAKLPQMQGAKISVCEIDKNTKFTGFNRPEKILRHLDKNHIVVYPKEVAEKDRAKLIKFAQKNNLKVATVFSHKESKCVRITKGKNVSFVVDPALLKLHSWIFKPGASETTTLLSKQGLISPRKQTPVVERREPKVFLSKEKLPAMLTMNPSIEQEPIATFIPRGTSCA